MKKIIYILIFFILVTSILSTQSTSQDKYTVVNIMIKKIYFTPLGLIIEYSYANKIRHAYLPNKLFEEGIAVKVIDDYTPSSIPQMNLIFKNSEQFKVKIYLPSNPVGPTYPLIDYLSDEMKENFKKAEKLSIDLGGGEGQQVTK